ncbi:MAG: IS200/IS605 family transposase, partial [Proteobacteria bacterium]|nr:IS200/IS605 family transposase [Pseudomonadota bacterium]
YFCATVGQMTEAMIEQYLEHHFEPKPNDDFKMDPD